MNGAPWLETCLQGLMRQTQIHETEIIAIDSGSTDGSQRILQQFPLRLYHVHPSTFNHGLTRQFGVEQSRGEYIAFTVQDAHPVDENWLSELMRGFDVKENVAGVCGAQIVQKSEKFNPVEWFKPFGEPTIASFAFEAPCAFESLSAHEKMRACGWDNVTAMYKRSVMMDIPFQDVSFGEDAIWAKGALLAGYTLVYNPSARVHHYHEEDFDYALRRNLAVMYMRFKQFGCTYSRPQLSTRQFLSILKRIASAYPCPVRKKVYWLKYNKMQFRARVKAYELFKQGLADSEAALDALYQQYCAKPPVHQVISGGQLNII